jgi:hypothetical protein
MSMYASARPVVVGLVSRWKLMAIDVVSLEGFMANQLESGAWWPQKTELVLPRNRLFDFSVR